MERKLTSEEEFELKKINEESVYYNEPAYEFEIGDHIRYGYDSTAIVSYISQDKKIYGVMHEKSNCINFFGWQELRSVEHSNTNFVRNKDMRIDFNTTEISNILTAYYHFGVDMNPDYQRGYVWETEDKELLIDSIFNNIGIGKITLVRLLNGDCGYEILDGKQRLNTLVEFYENRFPYKGYYYNDLSNIDQAHFIHYGISVGYITYADKKTILKYFLMLNRTGKTMDKKQLDKVEKMLEEV